jgi:medium-chain acyl-[acyl-carrier-protein] hydrolase
VPIGLPGRESRIGEAPYTDLLQLSQRLADELAPKLDRPWVVLGHSMGAWLELELLRELRRRGAPMPRLAIVAASRAPQVGAPATSLHTLPEEQFVEAIAQQFDGIPPAVRGNDELLKLLLPALRADFQMLETYVYLEEPPLDVEIMALGGTEDPPVSTTDLAEWRRHTSGGFSARLFPGEHFFLFRGAAGDKDAELVPPALRTIVDRLSRLIPPADSLSQ